MKFLPQTNRNQLMLLPPSINDFVEDDHIVHSIDEIVEHLDTKAIEAQYSETGRRSISSEDVTENSFVCL